MYNVIVSLAKVTTNLPTGITFDHTDLTVTDAQGAVQKFSLNGSASSVRTLARQLPVGFASDGSRIGANDRNVGFVDCKPYTAPAKRVPGAKPVAAADAASWSQPVNNLADGVSNYVAQDVDSTGAPIGAAINQTFDPTTGAHTFPATSGISVTLA